MKVLFEISIIDLLTSCSVVANVLRIDHVLTIGMLAIDRAHALAQVQYPLPFQKPLLELFENDAGERETRVL